MESTGPFREDFLFLRTPSDHLYLIVPKAECKLPRRMFVLGSADFKPFLPYVISPEICKVEQLDKFTPYILVYA